MTILDTLNNSQSLVQQISSINKDDDIQGLLSSLSAELITLQSSIKQLQLASALETSKPEMKSGCYIFANQKGFFCPHCYDNNAQKVTTKRMNSKLRVCPACRTGIK